MTEEDAVRPSGPAVAAYTAAARDRALSAFARPRWKTGGDRARLAARRLLELQRATLLMYAAEGAVILARARRSVEPLTFIAEQLRRSRGEAPPGNAQT